jgi:hypothetical protein
MPLFRKKEVDVFNCWKRKKNTRTKKYQDDGISSLEEVDKAIVKITENIDDYKTIGFDGAHKIYSFVETEYKQKHGKRAVHGVKAHTTVGKRLREIFNPIIMFGQFDGKHIIINSEARDRYEPTGRYDEMGEMISEQTGFKHSLKRFVAHDVDMIIFMRIIQTPEGKIRVASFDKHAIYGDVPMNIGFKDLTYRKMRLIHKQLLLNQKEQDKIDKNPRYRNNAKITPLEELFVTAEDRGSFRLDQLSGMRQCIYCGAFIAAESVYCPTCGKVLRRRTSQEKAEMISEEKDGETYNSNED